MCSGGAKKKPVFRENDPFCLAAPEKTRRESQARLRSGALVGHERRKEEVRSRLRTPEVRKNKGEKNI